MLLDKEGLIEVLSNMVESVKGMPQNSFFLKIELFALDPNFNAPELKAILEKAAISYMKRTKNA
ncbi:MAG: hypothetical protein WC479_05810 [Candidatus Izemoplasmatales bacterium]